MCIRDSLITTQMQIVSRKNELEQVQNTITATQQENEEMKRVLESDQESEFIERIARELSLIHIYRSIPLESGRGPVDREEERRLCYVGMTRAKEELILAGWGDPSPFEKELPAGACQIEAVGEAPAAKQMTLF